jgi:hypothetical protein
MASIGVCAVVFASITGAWLLLPASVLQACRPLEVNVSPPSSSDWYLGYFNMQVEQYAVYQNLDGAAEALKHADVLLVGDSLVLFSFQDREVLRKFFAARGLSYFLLAFSAEADEVFPEAIIRKFDLHPKLVIVNADAFFGMPPSPAASRAMTFGYLEAWKSRFEAATSLAILSRVHRIFPDLALSQWETHPQWIWYRAKSDGAMLPVAWRGTPKAISDSSPTDLVWQDARRRPPSSEELKDAQGFKDLLDSRGSKLVLTWIPPTSGATARHLASALRVPLVIPRANGLSTIDGKHLDRESSTRFGASFLTALGKIVDQNTSDASPSPLRYRK